ncbi:hypothetical protein IY145_14130 [Methylosinus sp. H3A]|uniref:hypothetical protein n=1 Tax=Methylosinus sp. H3A TaxID=2785786 RepID=UPI0018C2645F|nr:hypothetical protein [Methylosinus sp. H3A]MBG0810506.1 hypothetical protein [Methylosinus sp. H3A]
MSAAVLVEKLKPLCHSGTHERRARQNLEESCQPTAEARWHGFFFVSAGGGFLRRFEPNGKPEPRNRSQLREESLKPSMV